MDKTDEIVKCKYLFYCAGGLGLELFNSSCLSEAQEKLLKNSWDNFKALDNPQRQSCKQGSLSLEEFITKLRTLAKEAHYPQEQHS